MKSRLFISLLMCLSTIASAQTENTPATNAASQASTATHAAPQGEGAKQATTEATTPAKENAASTSANAPAGATTPGAAAGTTTPGANAPNTATPAAPQVALPTAQAKAGFEKSTPCVACHNVDGNSTVPNWPKLAGQYEHYLMKQLHDFKKGEKGPRYNASMYTFVEKLTDDDIADLAAFYAAQKQTMGKANKDLVALGEKIYRGGNIETGATACAACHSPDGMGNDPANFPKLAGQHATYIENQLRDFKDRKRTNAPSGMMVTISHKLTEDEMKAVSSFIEGLREGESK